MTDHQHPSPAGGPRHGAFHAEMRRRFPVVNVWGSENYPFWLRDVQLVPADSVVLGDQTIVEHFQTGEVIARFRGLYALPERCRVETYQDLQFQVVGNQRGGQPGGPSIDAIDAIDEPGWRTWTIKAHVFRAGIRIRTRPVDVTPRPLDLELQGLRQMREDPDTYLGEQTLVLDSTGPRVRVITQLVGRLAAPIGQRIELGASDKWGHPAMSMQVMGAFLLDPPEAFTPGPAAFLQLQPADWPSNVTPIGRGDHES